MSIRKHEIDRLNAIITRYHTAYQQACKSYRDGKISEDDIRQSRRELLDARSELYNFRNMCDTCFIVSSVSLDIDSGKLLCLDCSTTVQIQRELEQAKRALEKMRMHDRKLTGHTPYECDQCCVCEEWSEEMIVDENNHRIICEDCLRHEEYKKYCNDYT
jgi:hypothetical protein